MTPGLRAIWVPLLMVWCAGLVFSQDHAATPEWKEYSYADDGFAMRSPAEPTLQKQQQATASGNIEMRLYSVDLTKDSGVLMSVSDFANADHLSPKEALEEAVNGSIEATKAKKTSEKDIVLGQVPGIEFEADTAGNHMLGRYYWENGRLFSLLAVTPLGASMPQEALRVMDSVRLMPSAPAPKQERKEYSYPEDGFAITALVQPAFEKEQHATASGNIEMREYTVDMPGNVGVLMSVSDLANTNHATPHAILEGAVNGGVQAAKAKKTSEKDIELQQVPGIEYEADTDAYHLLGRYYWQNGRLFSLVAIAPLGAPMPADARRVLDSFKFVAK